MEYECAAKELEIQRHSQDMTKRRYQEKCDESETRLERKYQKYCQNYEEMVNQNNQKFREQALQARELLEHGRKLTRGCVKQVTIKLDQVDEVKGHLTQKKSTLKRLKRDRKRLESKADLAKDPNKFNTINVAHINLIRDVERLSEEKEELQEYVDSELHPRIKYLTDKIKVLKKDVNNTSMESSVMKRKLNSLAETNKSREKE